MKYGLLNGVDSNKLVTNSNVDKNKYGTHILNAGDCVQQFAVKRIYMEVMNIKEEDIVEIHVKELSTYQGETLVLPINLFFYSCKAGEYVYFPCSSNIIPVFIGLHLSCELLTEDEVEFFKKSAPIGCRDNKTLATMKKYDIDSYLYGCVSMTLSRRETTDAQKKIFLVDVDESILSHMPEDLKSKAEVIEQVTDSSYCPDKDVETSNNYYNKLRDEAAMMITGLRLHSFLPCLAMGIPSIYINYRDCLDQRFDFLSEITPTYDMKSISEVNWAPDAVEMEYVKSLMIPIFQKRMESAYKNEVGSIDLEEIQKLEALLNKKEYVTSLSPHLMDQLNTLSENAHSYILWGATSLAEDVYNYYQVKHPHMELVAIIDEFSVTEFHGFQTVKSSDLVNFESVPLVCTPIQSKSYIEATIKSYPNSGKRLYMDGEIIQPT